MDGGYTVRIEYDWILEPHYRLAQGLPSSLTPASLTKRSQLLIPWRFFRLWSLLDGLDPPENMVRCMANNYSTLGFWRAWHRSYNLWVVRSVPLSPFSPLALIDAEGTSTSLLAARTPFGRRWSCFRSSRCGMTSRLNSSLGAGSSPSSSFPRWARANSFRTRRCGFPPLSSFWRRLMACSMGGERGTGTLRRSEECSISS